MAKICRKKSCEAPATSGELCRIHYLMSATRRQAARKPEPTVSIDDFAHEMLNKYPDEFIKEAYDAGYDYDELTGFSYQDELDSVCDALGSNDSDLNYIVKSLRRDSE